MRQEKIILKNESRDNEFLFNFVFFGNKRNQVRMRNEYNMSKTKKTMEIKNKNYINNFFIIFNFIFYYLLILNAVL